MQSEFISCSSLKLVFLIGGWLLLRLVQRPRFLLSCGSAIFYEWLLRSPCSSTFRLWKEKDHGGSPVGCTCGLGLEAAHITFITLHWLELKSLGNPHKKRKPRNVAGSRKMVIKFGDS